MDGVLRTRVGYAGGTSKNPTYHHLGDHTEAVSVDFDPTVISYRQLLDHFWDAHHATSNSFSTQYKNAVFFRDGSQHDTATRSLQETAARLGIDPSRIKTGIVPVRSFTYAEDDHQKYLLGRLPELRDLLAETYPDTRSLADSTVATRLNALLGHPAAPARDRLLAGLHTFGLPAPLEAAVRVRAGRHLP